MNILELIQNNRMVFADLCRLHKVGKLYAFGSSVTDRFDPERSDIDVVVKIDIADPADRGDALLSLWDKLELFFKRKVDLLTEESIQNPYLRKSIDQTKQLIYDGSGEEILI